MTQSLVPLPELGRALMERFGVPSPGYHAVHRAICKGILKPERLGGRYFFKPEDLPMVAAVLGIAVPVKGSARRASVKDHPVGRASRVGL